METISRMKCDCGGDDWNFMHEVKAISKDEKSGYILSIFYVYECASCGSLVFARRKELSMKKI